jgi:hypothetical protein
VISTSQSFSVAELVGVGADTAFAFLEDGMNQRFWALGSWDRRDVGDGVFVGTSLLDGTQLYVRPIPNPSLLLVDFETGEDPTSLAHEVEARVIPGPTLGHAEQTCLVVLTVFRRAAGGDESWEQAWHMFHTEIQMIKGRLERGFR